MRRMARALALAISRPQLDPIEALRGALVMGCALALILGGPALPSIL